MKKVFNTNNLTYLMLVLSIGATLIAFGLLIRDAVVHNYINGIFYALGAILNAYWVTEHMKSIKLIKRNK
jgi:hypothetical protein